MTKPKKAQLTQSVTCSLTEADAKELRKDAAKQEMTPSAFLRALWRTWKTYKKAPIQDKPHKIELQITEPELPQKTTLDEELSDFLTEE